MADSEVKTQKIKDVVVKIVGITLGIIAMVALVGHFVFTPVSMTHTYTLFGHSSPPGALVDTTNDFSNIWWTLVSLFSFGALALVAIGNNKLANTIVIIVLASCMILSVVLFISGFKYAWNCNEDGFPNGACHDKAYCCAFFANAVNLCPNIITGACTVLPGSSITPGDGSLLKPDLGFVYTYGIIVVMFFIFLFGIVAAIVGMPEIKQGFNINSLLGIESRVNNYRNTYQPRFKDN